ncbi:MAG: hypothetical protein IKR44_05695 [Bacteroidales bacterium]|nr:hypothetical protein [Bacteroidales bacterium]
MSKDSFILYLSHFPALEELSDEQLGRLFRALYLWQIEGKEPTESDIRPFFKFMSNQIRIDREKYDRKVRNLADNGRKGGIAKQRNRELANASKSSKSCLNDNDNDNDNVMNHCHDSLSLSPAVGTAVPGLRKANEDELT